MKHPPSGTGILIYVCFLVGMIILALTVHFTVPHGHDLEWSTGGAANKKGI